MKLRRDRRGGTPRPVARFRPRSVLRHTEAISLIGLLALGAGIAAARTSNGLPAAIWLLGVVFGGGILLQSIGVVLVYKSNRIVNFAQVQLGLVGANVFMQLASHRTFIWGLRQMCGGCVPAPKTLGEYAQQTGTQQQIIAKLNQAFSQLQASGTNAQTTTIDARTFHQFLEHTPLGRANLVLPEHSVADAAVRTAPGYLVQINYWLSLLVGLAMAAGLVYLVYITVVRKFDRASKLVLTVVTIAAGVLVNGIGNTLLRWIYGNASSSSARSHAGPLSPMPVPFHLGIHVGEAIFSAYDVLTVVVALAAVAGMAWFFRRTATGIVLRGVAENPDRATTLGVNPAKVASRAWMIAGVLSGIAAWLAAAPVNGHVSSLGTDYTVLVLAAAAAGGLLRLPLTLAGALVLGVISQLMLWATGSNVVVNALVFLFIMVVFLAQRARASRAEIAANESMLAARMLRPIPGELRNLPAVRTAVRIGVVLLVIWAVGYPWIMSPSDTNLGSVAMIFVIVLLSLLVLTGWTGQISLGQMSLAAVGAWVTAASGLPMPIAVALGAVAGSVAALIIGLPALRLRGLHLAVSTLAFATGTYGLLFDRSYLGSHLPSSVRRPSLFGMNLNDERSFFYLTLVLLIGVVLAVSGMRRSRTARALIAVRDNEAMAQAVGINLLRARAGAFMISGAMSAFAGGLFVYSQRGIDPVFYSPDASVKAFLLAVVGGVGAIAGPLLGGAWSGIVSLIDGTPFGGLDIAQVLLHPSLGALVLLMATADGLAGLAYAGRNAWLRRIASRNRIEVPSLIADRARVNGETVVVEPLLRPTGGQMFVPTRYRLSGQWMIDARDRDRRTTAGSRG